MVDFQEYKEKNHINYPHTKRSNYILAEQRLTIRNLLMTNQRLKERIGLRSRNLNF